MNNGNACITKYFFKAKVSGMKDKITWSTSDSDIASVNSSGKVTALSSGTVTIFANAGGKTTKCELIIGTNRIGTFSKNISIYNDYTIWITVSDLSENERLKIETSSSDIISCKFADAWEDNRLALNVKPKANGTDTINITTNKTNDQLIIKVTIIDKPQKDELVLSHLLRNYPSYFKQMVLCVILKCLHQRQKHKVKQRAADCSPLFQGTYSLPYFIALYTVEKHSIR